MFFPPLVAWRESCNLRLQCFDSWATSHQAAQKTAAKDQPTEPAQQWDPFSQGPSTSKPKHQKELLQNSTLVWWMATSDNYQPHQMPCCCDSVQLQIWTLSMCQLLLPCRDFFFHLQTLTYFLQHPAKEHFVETAPLFSSEMKWIHKVRQLG